MSAPQFVPVSPRHDVRSYESPPWRPDPWFTDRPAELRGRQPSGDGLGVPGPDQGYALTLAERFRGRLNLVEGESEADALAGAGAVAMKRAALFGRAPVIHDLTVGLTVWGFLEPNSPAELLELRRELFDEAHVAVHYTLRRRIADVVPESVLLQTHDTIIRQHNSDWRACLDVPELEDA